MKTHLIIFIVSIACILEFTQGCTTGQVGGKEVSVRLSNEGRIYVGERYTGLKKMVKQLKADGTKKEDRIVIYIPPHTSQKAMTSIGRELASNGYPHILFKQEQRPSITIGHPPLKKYN